MLTCCTTEEAVLRFSHTQGNSFRELIQITRTGFNWSGAIARSYLKRSHVHSDLFAILGVQVIKQGLNEFDFLLFSNNTIGWKGCYVGDVEITYPDGTRTTYFSYELNVKPSVTKSLGVVVPPAVVPTIPAIPGTPTTPTTPSLSDLIYLKPSFTFVVPDTWISLGNTIPANAEKAFIEIDAPSNEIVVATFHTDGDGIVPAIEWAMTHLGNYTLETRQEILDFRVKRIAAVPACNMRVAYYGRV